MDDLGVAGVGLHGLDEAPGPVVLLDDHHRVVHVASEEVFGDLLIKHPGGGVDDLLDRFRPGVERTHHGVEHRRVIGHGDGVTLATQNGVDVREFGVDLDKGTEFGIGAFTNGGDDLFTDVEHVSSIAPGARRGPSHDGAAGLHEQLGLEVQERDDLLGENAGVQCPDLPFFEARFDLDVEQTVGHWRGHCAHGGTILNTVTGGDEFPTLGQNVLTNPAIEQELLAQTHHDRRGHVDFVEEEDALAFGGEEIGASEVGRLGLFVNERNPAEVGRCELRDTQVDEAEAEFLGRLLNDGGFTNAGRTPDHRAHVQVVGDDVLDEGLSGFDCCCFHRFEPGGGVDESIIGQIVRSGTLGGQLPNWLRCPNQGLAYRLRSE